MLLNDRQISKLAENDLFMPFVGEKCRTLDNGTKAISYGLSQAGYDLRLSEEEFLIVDKTAGGGHGKELDPKLSNAAIPYDAILNHSDGSSFFRLPPFSYGLGRSHELISMPTDVIGLCDGKSTYARCGIIINVTPIEPGWAGYLTISISNPTPLPVRIYANEGIVQVMLCPIEEVKKAYTGLYQNSTRVQLAAV
ncbi:Dcd Deoxycytidine deaminase [uncultured Caudovirales phage]|uniref:Dcd Deoxycytidine deaminase n=1 Tax=uncultured Caudovirales phage TaxID=2100421 RepID=A0A6J5NCD6_9CAUD|nr:Dcd Deoxycytidine deaminase [uncultured Caudovirales phage]